MIYLLVSAIFIVWLVLFFLAVGMMLEREGVLPKIPIIFFLFLTVAWIAYVSDSEPDRPCVKYEQRMMYNAATKMMMPARVCVERGEWVE